MTEKWNIEELCRQFRLEGGFVSARRFGSGHIHDTFLIETGTPQGIKYILQRINHYVFRHPPKVMENIVRVTRHIRGKLQSSGMPGDEINRRVLTVIPTTDGGDYYRDAGGDYWRAYIYIPRASSRNSLDSLEQLYQAAKMFGQFLEMLRNLPDPPLHETIPGFHNGPGRLEEFRRALDADTHNRAKNARPEIEFLLAHAGAFDMFQHLLKKNKIPVRVTHNDTKVNNILLDETTGEGVCVIDLDTVMPGISLYDFGDLVRTTISPMAEDERDLSRVSVEIPRFKAVLSGFLNGTGGSLNRTEKQRLVSSGRFMTQLVGMRFLTDYLQGDPYFNVQREGHNLDRCRRQFKLVQSIIDHEEELEKMVQDY
jgi:aminoglycoside phosphotransferase (APT) family kinase protein